MNEMGFNIYKTDNVTKENINVIFKPDENAKKIEYSIIKDDIKGKFISVDDEVNVLLKDTGKYQLIVKTYDKFNKETTHESGIYLIDKQPPVINAKNNIEITTNEEYNLLDGVSAFDNYDGDITNKIVIDKKDFSLDTEGVKKIGYEVVDSAGNISRKEIDVNVTIPSQNGLLLIQTLFFSFLLLLLLFIFKYNKSINLEKRISKYSITPLKDEHTSLIEKLSKKYNKLLKKLSTSLSKVNILNKYSKKYSKYLSLYRNYDYNEMDFISSKFMVSIVFVIMAIFSKMLNYELFSIYELFIPLIVGFFAPDIFYIIKYRMYRRQIENDLLQAIIIMNNAFKSGRSITQAIDLVSNELDGAIGYDFGKMYKELASGLTVEDVFKRFSKRIELEEVTYLTASLSILNRTGGNIIKVFSSIEKSLFSKKKLRLELKSLTGSSKLIIYILFAVPILFVLFISLVDPSYFAPFFESTIGIILLIIILILYVVYIFVVKKVMKVDI